MCVSGCGCRESRDVAAHLASLDAPSLAFFLLLLAPSSSSSLSSLSESSESRFEEAARCGRGLRDDWTFLSSPNTLVAGVDVLVLVTRIEVSSLLESPAVVFAVVASESESSIAVILSGVSVSIHSTLLPSCLPLIPPCRPAGENEKVES